MYIPSEAIYYEIIRDEMELMPFAQTKKILLVSRTASIIFESTVDWHAG